MITHNTNSNKGFTLFVAIIVMGTLLLVATGIVSLAVKQALITSSSKESQIAFFAADSGIECALYWDVRSPSGISAFDTGDRSTFADYYLTEFSGINTTTPLDKASTKIGQTSGAENELVFSNSVNTTAATELIFSWFGEGGNGPVSEGPGFFASSYLRNNLQEYKVVTSAGSHNASAYFENLGHAPYDYMVDILTFKAAAAQTPAFVQVKGQYIEIPDPVTLAFDNPSTSGDLIIVSITYNKNIFDIVSVSDNKGNVYVRALGPTGWPNQPWVAETWYAKNIIGGGSPIEITANSPAFVAQDVDCNGQHFSAGVGATNDVTGTNPTQPHRIGGGGIYEPTSIFQLNFPNNTCAIVRITKEPGQPTEIESRGYNTCDTSNSRRVERAIRATY